MKYNIALFAILVFLISACTQNIPEDQHDHSEEIKNQFTVYTNDLELFAETDLFVENQTAKVLSLFSILPNFKALENGHITLRLITASGEVSETLEKPTQKGVYSFNITPKWAGKGKLVYEIKRDGKTETLLIPEVEIFKSESELHGHAHDSDDRQHTDGRPDHATAEHTHEHGQDCDHGDENQEQNAQVHDHDSETHDDEHDHATAEQQHEHGQDCDHDAAEHPTANNQTPTGRSSHQHETSANNATVFTKEQSWKIDFATAHPKEEAFGQVIKTVAQIENAPIDEIVIAAKTNGIVQFAGHNVLAGQTVISQQLLMVVSTDGLAYDNIALRLIEAQNDFEKAQSDYERTRLLAKDQIVTERELLTSKNVYDNAKANLENLEQSFEPTGQKVKSPMKGYIKEVNVKNGQYVEAGQALILVSCNKSLLLHADVQAKYAPILESIHTANVRILPHKKTYSLEQLNGEIVSYGKSTNSSNFQIPVILQIENTGEFIPGSFVELYLKSKPAHKKLVVPNSALLEEQGHFFVFVQITPELFEKSEVVTGATDGQRTEIISGLCPSQRIVTRGGIFIKLAQSSGTLDPHSGHVH